MAKSKGNNYNITHSRLAITQRRHRTKIYQASQFKELGIKLSFSPHVDMIKNIAMRNITCGSFMDLIPLKIVHSSLICS